MITAQVRHGMLGARSRLAGVRNSLADFAELHKKAGGSLTVWVQRNFDAQGSLLADFPSGWPPLAQATLEGRRRRGLGSQILVATGRMRRGFTLRSDGHAATVGNQAPYAAMHQVGGGVPRRPILPSAPQVLKIIIPGVLQHVQGAIGPKRSVQ